jgi:hypothetical protein
VRVAQPDRGSDQSRGALLSVPPCPLPPGSLAGRTAPSHTAPMFTVTETAAAAIRVAFEQRGEFAAAVELRRLFPGVTDNTRARACARIIAGWKSLPAKPRLAGCPARGCNSGRRPLA